MAKVTEIRVEVGGLESIGDYTNTKVSFSLMAELEDGDDAIVVLSDLTARATAAYHAHVDDEREAHGLKVRYYTGPLYQVGISRIRECVVISPETAKLLDEKTWKDADDWSSSFYDVPDYMRLEKARCVAEGRATRHAAQLPVFECLDSDFSALPPLPDPGPEPV